jgi:hypothetical protein
MLDERGAVAATEANVRLSRVSLFDCSELILPDPEVMYS